MSILSRLCRYVGTHGYTSATSAPAAGFAKRGGGSRRQRYMRACMEQMESRIMLTTLQVTGGQTRTFTFYDTQNKNFEVTLHGDITVELYGSQGGTIVDLIPPPPPKPPANYKGVDIFAMYITSSDINSYISVAGTAIRTGDPGPLYMGAQGGGRPIAVPGNSGQIYIGELANGTPVSNIPSITSQDNGAVVLSPAAQTLAAATNGFDGTNLYSGVYSANSIGKILIDGTVTGNVAIEGSIGTFYCGWLVTGDVTGSGAAQTNNFDVTGDLGGLYVNSDIGSNVATIPAGGPAFDAGTQITVGGKIGTISVAGGLLGSVNADNVNSNLSLISLGYVWQEPTTYVDPSPPGSVLTTFLTGQIPITSAADPFFNGTFATATYVGTLDLTAGKPSITLNATLQGFLSGHKDNPVDYYAFGVLAGQTVNVSVTTLLSTMQLGVFDSDNRLIFSEQTDVSGLATITFTADRPGAYRVAVGLPGDLGLTGNAGLFTTASYALSITGVSDMAIGGIRTAGDIDIEDPGIDATTGDIGAIAAKGNLLSDSLAGASVINVNAGNLLDVEGGSIGRGGGGVISEYPTITVTGELGYIDSGSLLFASVFASGDIQVLNAVGDMEGTYVSNAAIGVIRAGSFLGIGGTAFALIEANADDVGNDGIIDLIDIAGDLGSVGGGPRIETGIGGNVRYMFVGGSVFQDPAFGTGGTSTLGSPYGDGGIVYLPGEAVSITDDSGSHLTVTPGAGTSTVGANGTVTTTAAGQITAYTYGIYGTGGVVIVKLVTTGNITITSSSASSAPGQSAEIGQIIDTGVGAPLGTTNVGGTATLGANGTPILNANGTPLLTGGVVLPANDALAVATSLNAITIAGNILTSVFDVTDSTSVINSLTDSTGGDIVNLNVGDVGTLAVRGNIGSTSNTTGAQLNQSAVLNNTFPFQQQHIGLVANNIVSITATGSVGNVMAAGSVGSIVADASGGTVKNTLVGITGPILVGGNLGTINIGEGLAFSGEVGFSPIVSFGAGFSRAGIYVTGAIVDITGNNADIRGEIISTAAVNANNPNGIGIEQISLTNGSIIGAQIGVYATIASAGYLSRLGIGLPIVPGSSFANPLYPIQSISISGNGGIIGSSFEGSNIGSVTVASTGFGILNSGFITLADGVMQNMTGGGYGIRGVFFTGNKIISLDATGGGQVASPAQFSSRVRGSENFAIDPYTGLAVSSDTDLDLFLSTAGDGDSDYREGVIGESSFSGQSLGTVTAFSIVGIGAGNSSIITTGDTFDFANNIGTIKVLSDVLDVRIITGSLGNLTIGGNANGLDLEAAGAIGSIYIAGNFDQTSLILAKGPSSSIKSLTVVGNFAGTLTSLGFINTLIIGGTGKKNSSGIGSFTGKIQLLGGSSAKNLVFASGFTGDFEVGGSVGSISFLQGLSSTAILVVHGSLGTLTIGGDKTKNLGLAGQVTIQGNLGSLLGGGAFTGTVLTTGNLSKIKYAGTMGGSVTADGSIGSYTLTGDVAGSVIANGSIGPIKIAGNIASTGSFTSFAGAINSVTIAKGGTMDGRLSAGSIGKIVVPAVGANAKIVTGNLASLTVQGNVTGALVQASGAITAIAVGGTVTSSVITGGQAIKSLKVKGGVVSSVIQTGITGGNDTVYGSGDANEVQSLGYLGSVSIGSLVNSVVAAGGPIGSFISGALVDSSVSSGLVLNGTALQHVVAGTNPLTTAANLDTLRTNPTLFFGNIGSINIANGAEGGLDANSAISAGISPGADGIFEASDISNPASAAGTSTILKLKLAADEDAQVFEHNPA